jgi:hypothetical protein
VTPLAFLLPLAFLFVGLAAAGLLGFLAYRSGQTQRRAAEVVRCRVAEMRDGVCKVKGRLVARGEVLTSPLTGKKCLFYRFQVDQAYLVRTWTTQYGPFPMGEGDTRMSDGESYRPLVEDQQRVAVALEDETGTAYLDLRDVEGDSLLKKVEAVIDTSRDANLPFELMLEKRYGCSTLVDRRKNMGAGSRRGRFISESWAREGREQPKVRVCEEVIEEGTEVFVVGEVETCEGRPPRFHPVDHPLIVATHPKEARLPRPGNPATGLWVAAGVVLGVTLLLTLVGLLIVAANVRSAPRYYVPPVRSLPRR